MGARIEVIHPDGAIETFPIAGEATLGRSLEADVSIPDARDLEPQHVRLRPQLDGCAVEVANTARLPVQVAGKAFASGVLPWGAELTIGELRIRLLPEEKGRNIGLGTLLSIAMMLGAAALVYAWWTSRPQIELDLRTQRDAPPILVDSVDCNASGDQARRRAEGLAEAAEAKSDRYAFDPQDGIAAVEMYAYAASCFRAAGSADMGGRLEARSQPLRQRIEEDYRIHRLRLERALDQEEYEEALEQAIYVYRFVSHTETDYMKWLASIIQKLRLRVEAAKDKS